MNTRCLYLRLFSSDLHLPLSNLTLCPIVDFANHTASFSLPQIYPRDISSIVFADDQHFSFISPSCNTRAGEELYLRYGGHCNRTLFTEYGFVDDDADARDCEVDVSDIVETLLRSTARFGDEMRRTLEKEGYLRYSRAYLLQLLAFGIDVSLLAAGKCTPLLRQRIPPGSFSPPCDSRTLAMRRRNRPAAATPPGER